MEHLLAWTVGCLLHSTGSSQSSHTSKYFGSIDSSEAEAGAAQARAEPGDQVIKYVLQDPIQLLMANADQRVMMTYQVPLQVRTLGALLASFRGMGRLPPSPP